MARIQSLTTIQSVSNTDILAIEHNTGTGTYKVPISMLLSDVYSKSEAVAKADIVNDLTSTDPAKVLAAPQGKELSDRTTVDGVLGSNNVASSWNVIKTGITLMPGRKAATTGYPTFESENSEGACITIASPSSVNYARQLFIPNNKLSISAERIISGGTIGDWKQVSQIDYFWCETGSNITYQNNGRLSIVVTAPSNQNLIIALVATDGTPYAAVGTIPSSITISRTSGTGTSSVIKVSNAVGWTLPIWVLRAYGQG